ncbi:5608_t:CDS:2, partial [Scutellospora calospora]
DIQFNEGSWIRSTDSQERIDYVPSLLEKNLTFALLLMKILNEYFINFFLFSIYILKTNKENEGPSTTKHRQIYERTPPPRSKAKSFDDYVDGRKVNEESVNSFESNKSRNFDHRIGNYERHFDENESPQAWKIVRCGYKIARSKWCSVEEYEEIKQYTKRLNIFDPPELVSRLLKLKSFESLGKYIKEIQISEKLNNDQ